MTLCACAGFAARQQTAEADRRVDHLVRGTTLWIGGRASNTLMVQDDCADGQLAISEDRGRAWAIREYPAVCRDIPYDERGCLLLGLRESETTALALIVPPNVGISGRLCLFVSKDNGVAWTEDTDFATPFTLRQSDEWYGTAQLRNSWLMVSNYTRCYISADFGRSWQLVSDIPYRLLWLPELRLLMARFKEDCRLSWDMGGTWLPLDFCSDRDSVRELLWSTRSQEVFVLTSGASVYGLESAFRGRSPRRLEWPCSQSAVISLVDPDGILLLRKSAPDPTAPATLILERSKDAGRHWTTIVSPFRTRFPTTFRLTSGSVENEVFLHNSQGLWRSADFGDTWTRLLGPSCTRAILRGRGQNL